MTKVIGLTGGIGSGKSTVARIMHKFGAVVIDTDKIGHAVYKPSTVAWEEIVDAFGKQVLTINGEIDRGVLGNIVFNDFAALNRLNMIVHPRILEKVLKLLKKYRNRIVPVIVIEAPLLIEVGWHKMVDEVWVVTAPKAAVAERLKKQRNFSKNDIASWSHTRLSESVLIKQADVVIRNDGGLEQLQTQVAEAWSRLTKKCG